MRNLFTDTANSKIARKAPDSALSHREPINRNHPKRAFIQLEG